MKGLELARALYETQAREVLIKQFPELFPRMAIGLAGEGSECLGFDDALSRDHDWGPGFCIWLEREDFQTYGRTVQAVYDSLPGLEGVPPRRTTPQGVGRVGVQCTQDWYRRYTGCPEGPRTLEQWRQAPEAFLSVAVSGALFSDPQGAFSAVRRRISALLPPRSEEKTALTDAICAIHVDWLEALETRFPHLSGRGRPVRSREDGPGVTSFETYLWGELSTYSVHTLGLYRDYVEQLRQAGRNLNTVHQYGWSSLEAAEEALRAKATLLI